MTTGQIVDIKTALFCFYIYEGFSPDLARKKSGIMRNNGEYEQVISHPIYIHAHEYAINRRENKRMGFTPLMEPYGLTRLNQIAEHRLNELLKYLGAE